MGRKGRNRKRHLINVNPSVTELPNTTSMDYAYQPRPKLPTIVRPMFVPSGMSSQPVQVPPFSGMPSRFSLHSDSRRWLSPIPFWHSKLVFPQFPNRPSLPVAIVPPLPGVQVRVCAANANLIPSTTSAPDSVKLQEIQILAEETKIAVESSIQDHLASTQVPEATVDVRACEAESNTNSINCTTISVSSASIPVTVQSTTHQATKPSVNAGGDTALNSKPPNIKEEDDVIFLYRVEPNEGKLVEVVDLAEDPDGISSRNLVLSSQNTSSSKESEKKDGLNQSSYDSQDVLEIYSSIPILEQSKGPDLPTNPSRKRKREENNVDTHCRVCHKDYDGIYKDDDLLFISKCGHLFCMDCLRNLVPYKCTECNAGISNLCKVIF